MNWLDTLYATSTAWLVATFSAPGLRWIAMLLLCSAYLQGGLTKAFDFSTAIDRAGF